MKSAATLVAAVVLTITGTNNNVVAFSPNPIPSTTSRPSTRLRFDIIAPPDEDNCELDGSDCEESVFARKKRERQEGETKLREKYTEAGLKLSDIDRMETPDMYNAGGMNGIIPGVQLSTLREDD